MIRTLLLASVGLHVAMIALLPDAKLFAARAPETPSLVELASEAPPPPPPEKEPPLPSPDPVPVPSPSTIANRAPKAAAMTTPTAAIATGATTDSMPGLAVDGDGPADFTASVISNGAAGPASKIVVSAPAVPAKRSSLVIVPVSSLSRRPGAPGLDAELERNYPVEARRAGISGSARLRVQILSDGRVDRVERLSESYAGFGEACVRTVRAARWDPPLDEDGRAVATEIVYVCKFEVRS